MSDRAFYGIAIVVMYIAGLALGAWFSSGNDDQYWHDELARRGVAHYYLDGKNQRQWNWIEPQKPEAKP